MKNIGFLTLLITATLLLTLAFPAAAASPKPAAAPAALAVAPVAPATPAAAPVPDRHPHVDEALQAMRTAKRQLETAEHTFDGHRDKALEHLNMAIHEAEICLTMR